MALRALIFDIGNVLLRFDFNLALAKLAADGRPVAEEVLARLEPLKAAYEDGRLSRADWQAQTRALLMHTGTDADFVRAWEDIFTVNEPMAALLPELAARYPLYLLSNTSDLHLDYICRQYPFFSLFRDGVYSFRARVSKPAPDIYALARKQFGLDPATTLFIDDLVANIEAARAFGFQTHHYHHEAHPAFLTTLRAAESTP